MYFLLLFLCFCECGRGLQNGRNELSSNSYIFKETFKTRAVKYLKIQSVDYKYVFIPDYLTSFTLSVKFIRWIGYISFCKTHRNITARFKFGSFPMFDFDRELFYNLSDSQQITFQFSTVQPTSAIFHSPRFGWWVFGAVYDENDLDILPICLADLEVSLTGLVVMPDITLYFNRKQNYISRELELSETRNLLLELKSDKVVGNIRVITVSNNCKFIATSARKSIPKQLTYQEAVKAKAVFHNINETVVYWPHFELFGQMFLYFRSELAPRCNVHIKVTYDYGSDHTDFEIYDPAPKVRLDSLFSFKFINQHSDSSVINFPPNKTKILPFYIEPVKDQGGILTVTITVNSKLLSNISMDVCISDRAFPYLSMDNDRQFCKKSYVGSKSSEIVIYYPDWGWWYVTMALSNVIIEQTSQAVSLSISSSRCAPEQKWCKNRGRCLLSGFDVGMLWACHCTPEYYRFDCSGTFNDSENVWRTNYRRNLLVLSNLVFIMPAIIAIGQRLFLLMLMYLITAGFSMVYHMCSNDHGEIVTCMLPVEKLAYFDHIAAVTSIWVTLMIFTTLSDRIQLILDALMFFISSVLACVIPKSFWFYGLPISVGTVIVIVSWLFRIYYLRVIFPPIDWWLLGLCPGFITATAAFVMFRLSVTPGYEYYLYHSLWHILIALSICFVIPNSKRWKKALMRHSDRVVDTGRFENVFRINNERWHSFKKNINYYLHLDVLINHLLERNSRWSICKSY